MGNSAKILLFLFLGTCMQLVIHFFRYFWFSGSLILDWCLGKVREKTDFKDLAQLLRFVLAVFCQKLAYNNLNILTVNSKPLILYYFMPKVSNFRCFYIFEFEKKPSNHGLAQESVNSFNCLRLFHLSWQLWMNKTFV